MLAAAHGDTATLAELLAPATTRSGAAANANAAAAEARLHAKDPGGATALMLAAAAPSKECVEALLGAGAGVAECDKDGRCALRTLQ